tara:strand:+ start:575 stop:1282 length:708 start_codon:yes stop_codon:yes gene_type:complete
MNKKVLLCNGIGNRINQILNYVDELDKVTFIWSDDKNLDNIECGATWEDLFSFPKLNVVYGTYDKKKFHNPSSFKFRSNNQFQHEHDKVKLKAAQQFIKSLVPSKQVSKLMSHIPEGTCGYAVRLFHPISPIKNPIKIPSGSFLTTDSEEQRLFSPKTIQTQGVGGTGDKCINTLGKQGAIRAIADWFCLFKCEKIIEIGPSFTSLNHRSSKKGPPHSTFVDAHRILGCNVINLS